ELLANYLASNGFNEMMGLSLIESRLYQNLGLADEDNYVGINNTSNVHLDIMRPDMLLSGLQSVAYNLNRQQTNLNLFELGKSYQKSGDSYIENELLTIFITGKSNEESWLTDSNSDKSFYDIKKIILSILSRVNITNVQLTPIQHDNRFQYGLRAGLGPVILAEFGLVKKNVCDKLSVKSNIYYGEISIANLLKLMGKNQIHVKEISKFPSVRRDLALVVEKNVQFREIEDIARKVNKNLLKQIGLFDVYENKEHLGENKKSMAISLKFENMDRTLSDTEIEQIMNQIIIQLEEKLNAIIRK
nr:phenylalanine--tRNA ligase subunit beta [Saprospiraceae bacterium]